MSEGRIGVIGGSGLYGMEDLENVREVEVDTPFGAPSDAYITGTLQDRELVFLPRHGRGHRIAPSALNSRANIYGFKQLGVEWILSVSAVGSMPKRPGRWHITHSALQVFECNLAPRQHHFLPLPLQNTR